MNYKENIEQKKLLNLFLKENSFQVSVQFPENMINKLYHYSDLVVQTKEYGNLISANDSEKFLSRHIADSLIPYFYIIKKFKSQKKQNAQTELEIISSSTIKKWADMGAGAGCPIFPLAIVLPQFEFFAVEPRNKRVQFMEFAKKELQLENLNIVNKRFETSGLSNLDFISCRALSTFENDWERSKISLKNGGIFLTLKSFNNISYLKENSAVEIYSYSLPQENQVYALVTRGKNE